MHAVLEKCHQNLEKKKKGGVLKISERHYQFDGLRVNKKLSQCYCLNPLETWVMKVSMTHSNCEMKLGYLMM